MTASFRSASRLALLVSLLAYPAPLVHTNQHTIVTPRTVLLVGANRGIGFNLAHALASRDWNVIATVRPQTRSSDDPSIKEIEAVASQILEIDLAREQTIADAAQRFGDGPLDMLVNIAGLGPEPDNWYEHSAELLTEKYVINTVGPFLTAKYFHPNLKLARGKLINISSNAGSITMCKGEDLAYRMSKAALNMLTVTLAKEYQMNDDNITAIALNPGYVATRLTNFRSRDKMEECIAGMVKVMESVDMKDSGLFLDWRGETLPW